MYSTLDSSAESQTKTEGDVEAPDPPEKEVYYNDSLTSNITFSSLESDRVESSPLPTQITELDKIIRAGINNFLKIFIFSSTN